MAKETKAQEPELTPEGRLINHSLFILDQYNEDSKPSYKIEMAFEAGVLDDFYNKMLDYAVGVWGEGADSEEATSGPFSLITPILSGDDLKAKREAKGKEGDAYGGMEVIRANTIYNKHGDQGPGGIQVFDEDVEEVIGANQDCIYQGCMGQAAVVFGNYIEEGKRGDPDRRAITLYLNAFQKTGDGERLVAQKDHSKMFKKVGRTQKSSSDDEESSGRSGRGRRKG